MPMVDATMPTADDLDDLPVDQSDRLLDKDDPTLNMPSEQVSEDRKFEMPSAETAAVFGTDELKSKQAHLMWEMYTATRNRWFPFELIRIGELIFYEIRVEKIREEMYQAGGDVWFDDENQPVESPYAKILDKMIHRRNRIIKDTGFTRSMLLREFAALRKSMRPDDEATDDGISDEDEFLPR